MEPKLLLVGCPPGFAQGLWPESPTPARSVPFDELASHLPGPGLVLIGPEVERPVEVAQRARRLDRRAQLLIATPSDRLGPVSQSVNFAPLIGLSTRVLPAEDLDGLRAAVESAIKRVEQSRTLERNLDSARSQLAEARHPSGDYQHVIERLEAQERLLAAVVESSDDAIVSHELDGTIVSWNRAAEVLYGWTDSEVIGRSTSLIVPDDRREELREIDRRIRLGEKVQHLETVRMDKDGRRIDVSLTVSPVRIGGRIVGASGIARDCTERLRRERLRKLLADLAGSLNIALSDPQQPFAQVMELLGRGLDASCLLWLRDDEETDASLSACFEPNGQREQLLSEALRTAPQPAQAESDRAGDGIGDVAHESLAELDVCSAVLAPLAAAGGLLGVLRFADAVPFDHLERSVIQEAAHRIGAAAKTAQLLEQLRRRTDELSRSNKELDLFASIVSHDLQEPLRMVSAYSNLLADHLGDRLDETGAQLMHFAVDGAQRMRQMLQDLLAYARVGSRGRELVPLELEAVIETVRDNLRVAISEQEAELSWDPLPTVVGDESQLIQLLQNLVSNGLKFRAEDPPRVHVSVVAQNGQWRLGVTDNGIGIEPRYTERIFRMFRRLHTSEEYPGRGIGLALATKIVERHGGRIWVESQPGAGATFYFTLKAAPS